MSPNSLPPVDQLRQLFIYEPDTGRLIWRERPREMFKTASEFKRWNNRHAGKDAGGVSAKPSGYQQIQVRLNGKLWMAHRIAFAIYHGREPWPEIDHIDRNPINNRIDNLREASRSLNEWNKTDPRKNNNSGYLGVTWNKQREKWEAFIGIGGKQKHLGYHATPEQARAAYLAAKAKYHPNAIIA